MHSTLLPPKTANITLQNSTVAILAIDVPARGRIHKLSVARINTNGNAHTTAYTMLVTVFNADVVALGYQASVNDGRRFRYRVSPQLSVGSIGDSGMHPLLLSEVGVPFFNPASTPSEKVRKLYVELRPGNNAEGDYEVTWLISAT